MLSSRSTFYRVVVYVVALFSVVFSAATSTTTIINVCDVAAGHNVTTSPQLIIRAAPTSLTDVDVAVRIEGCTLPNGLHLTIAVPAYNGTYNGSVTVTIRHVTMHGGGSLVIKPDLTTLSYNYVHNKLFGLLQNVHVDVEHSTLEVKGDLLVVDATGEDVAKVVNMPLRPFVMQNVSMSVQFSTLRATGNVSSFITPDSIGTGVRNVHIYIGTGTHISSNSQFVASIVTDHIVGASLVLNSASLVDSTDGSCNGGPVTLRSTNNDVWMLSIGGRMGVRIEETLDILITDGSQLELCNGRLLRQCSAINSISVVAKANGTASIGSVCALSWRYSNINVYEGSVGISMHVLNTHCTASHVFRAVGSVAVVCSLAASNTQQPHSAFVYARDSDIRIVLSSAKNSVDPVASSNLSIEASSHGSSALFSFLMVSWRVGYHFFNSTVLIGARLVNTDNVLLAATTENDNSVVMGVALFTVEQKPTFHHRFHLELYGNSNVTIMLHAINTSNLVVKGSTVFALNVLRNRVGSDQQEVWMPFSAGCNLNILGEIVNSSPSSALPIQFNDVQNAFAVSFTSVTSGELKGTVHVDFVFAGTVRWTFSQQSTNSILGGVFFALHGEKEGPPLDLRELRLNVSLAIVQHALTVINGSTNMTTASLLFSSTGFSGGVQPGRTNLHLCTDGTIPSIQLPFLSQLLP